MESKSKNAEQLRKTQARLILEGNGYGTLSKEGQIVIFPSLSKTFRLCLIWRKQTEWFIAFNSIIEAYYQ